MPNQIPNRSQNMHGTANTIRRSLDIPGARTSYIERGDGPALVMVHGVGLNAWVWAPQLEAFSARYRTLAYDTLGHGDSDLPPAEAGLSDYAAQLRAVLDRLGIDRATLMGHSMGALIAILFAIENRDRVDRLVAVNPVYRRTGAQLAATRARVRELEEHGSDSTLGQVLERWFGGRSDTSEERVELVRQWIREADPRGYARAYRAFCEADPWLEGRLGELNAPALFVTGGADPNSTPDMARAMASDAPRGCSAVIAGERHMMAYAAPDRFNPVVWEFLEEGSGKGAASGRRAAKT